jgi:hypothetical protein
MILINDQEFKLQVHIKRMLAEHKPITKTLKPEPHTGVIFSNCFFFGLRTSSGLPSILHEDI